MMKKKKLLGKGISLLLICSMLLSITGTNTKVFASENTATETQNSDLPWADYKRITMEDFNINASTDEVGTPYNGTKSGTYKGNSLDGTYLDVDINFNGNFNNSYIQFFTKDWSHYVRFQGYDYEVGATEARVMFERNVEMLQKTKITKDVFEEKCSKGSDWVLTTQELKEYCIITKEDYKGWSNIMIEAMNDEKE